MATLESPCHSSDWGRRDVASCAAVGRRVSAAVNRLVLCLVRYLRLEVTAGNDTDGDLHASPLTVKLECSIGVLCYE